MSTSGRGCRRKTTDRKPIIAYLLVETAPEFGTLVEIKPGNIVVYDSLEKLFSDGSHLSLLGNIPAHQLDEGEHDRSDPYEAEVKGVVPDIAINVVIIIWVEGHIDCRVWTFGNTGIEKKLTHTTRSRHADTETAGLMER